MLLKMLTFSSKCALFLRNALLNKDHALGQGSTVLNFGLEDKENGPFVLNTNVRGRLLAFFFAKIVIN